jgi:thiamine-phosphate pyrophosphorylase
VTRRERLAAARIYLIVTPSLSPAWERAVRAALQTGLVGIVQLRSKDRDDAVLREAERLRALAEGAGALWVLNDRPELAARAGADGVHVGEGDPTPEEAREVVGPQALVGVSTHDEGEVAAASRHGADYAGLGPCFATRTKDLRRPPGGAELVRRCAGQAGALPLFPIGGIDDTNAGLLVAAGARRLAVGSFVLDAPDPGRAVRTLHQILAGSPGPG